MIDASAFQLLLMVVTGWLARREREVIVYLIEENRCLRRQLGSRRVRLTDDDRRRLAARAFPWTDADYATDRHARHVAAVAPAAHCAEMDVRPYLGQAPPGPGCDPSLSGPDGEREPDVGLYAIQGALKNVEHCVGRSRRASSREPVFHPRRTDLMADVSQGAWLAGADFFTTEVWTWQGLILLPPFPLNSPPGAETPVNAPPHTLSSATPRKGSTRFLVWTILSPALPDRIIPIGERHFRQVIAEFVEHYHRERNHQGLGNRLIAGPPVSDRTGRVRCRRRLGGLLNFYERAA